MNIPSVGKIDYNMKIPKIHINTDMVLDIRKKLVNCLFKPYEMENGSKVTVNDAKDVVIMLDGRIVAQWKSNHNRSISRIAAWEANADKYNKIGTHIVTASYDGDLRIFDKTGHQIRILQHCSPISALFVSDIETSFVDAVIVSGGQNGSIKMWGIKSGKLQREFIGHDHPIVDIAYIDNREQDVCLVSIDRLGEIKLWETISFRKRRRASEIGIETKRRIGSWKSFELGRIVNPMGERNNGKIENVYIVLYTILYINVYMCLYGK